MTKATVCHACGELVFGDACAACGTNVPVLDEPFSLTVPVIAMNCDCGRWFATSEEFCPGCGEPNEEPLDPREAGGNAARLSALRVLVDKYRSAIRTSAAGVQPLRLTGEQFITLMNEDRIIAADMIEVPKAIVRDLDLEGPSLTAAATEDALADLAKCAAANSEAINELAAIEVEGPLDMVRTLAMAAREAVAEIHEAVADALMVCTPDEVVATQLRLQRGLDAAAEAAASISPILDDIDPVSLDPDLTTRLRLFTGQAGTYTHRGAVDLAAVYGDVTSANLSQDERAGRVARTFRGVIPMESLQQAQEADLDALLLLSAEVQVSPNPVSFVRRLGPLVGLYQEALNRDPSSFSTTIESIADDAEDALVAMMSVADLLAQTSHPDLDQSTVRLLLSKAYDSLSEWVFRRLINVVLQAKFAIDGKSESYQTTAERSFGDKLHLLEQERDPRYATALIGLAAVIRNASAHGDVDLSGDQITFRQRDRKGRETVRTLSDDDFTRVLLNLLITCQALAMSVELFRFLRKAELPPARLPTRRRIQENAVRALLGRWGLRQVEIVRRDISCQLMARIDKLPTPDELLPAAAVSAGILSDWAAVELVVRDEDESLQSIKMPTFAARRFIEVDEFARSYAVILTWKAAVFAPPSTYDFQIHTIRGIARHLSLDATWLIGLQQSGTNAPLLERRRQALLAGCEIADEILRSESPSKKADVVLQKKMLTAIKTLSAALQRIPLRLNRASRLLEPLTRDHLDTT